MKRIPVDPAMVSRLGDQLTGRPLSAEDICHYLKDHPVVLAARTQIADRVKPSGAPIPVAFHTDGLWVWSRELAEYVCRYGHQLPEEFLDDLAARGVQPRPVSQEKIQEATALLQAARSRPPPSAPS